MPDSDELQVGSRIRDIRQASGYSLRALAGRCGLSVNAISRIERGESSPNVSSLQQLAAALSVPITDFFESGQEKSTILVRKNRRLRSHSEGVLIESLGTGLPRQILEPFLMTVASGAVGGEAPISHPGEEFCFCVEGEIEYLVDEEWYRLEAGDSMLFEAHQSHMCRNTSLDKAILLLVILAANEDARLSQHQHLLTT